MFWRQKSPKLKHDVDKVPLKPRKLTIRIIMKPLCYNIYRNSWQLLVLEYENVLLSVPPPQPALLHLQPHSGEAVQESGHHLHPGVRHHPPQH